MNPKHEPWQPWEEQFLIETYPLREWSAKAIAEKLERTEKAIFKKVFVLKITQPKEPLDRKAISELHNRGLNPYKIAKALGYRCSSVSYVLKVIEREAAA